MELELSIKLNDKYDYEDQLRGPLHQICFHAQRIAELDVGGKWALFSGEDNIVGYVTKLA